MLTRRQLVQRASGAAALPLLPRMARAQAYPTRFIKLILPFTAGSPNDVLARLVTPFISSHLGQNIVIDNRAGGGTSIGTRAVMTAEPDGYTLLFSNTPVHFVAPAVSKSFTYDPIKDFTPIGLVGTTSNVLVVIPSVPAKTLQEFVAYGKANPGKLNFGYGTGTLPQLIGALFERETGVKFANIPYRGGAQAVTDMLAGQIHLNLGTPSTLTPLVRDGRLRALAVTSKERNPDLPDVPTMTEAGLPAVTTTSYYGLLGPAGLPDDIVKRVNAAATESVKSPELKAKLAQVGFGPASGTPQEFTDLIAAEMKKWLPVVKDTGFQMD